MPLIQITRADDGRLAEYRNLSEAELLRRHRLFVAEGRLVVRRLLDSQLVTRSVMVTASALSSLEDLLGDKDGLPVYVVPQGIMNDIAGFNIHRGCLALVRRPPTPSLDRIAAGPLSRVLVLEGVNNPDNVGGLLRTAAAFGIELVVLGPNSGDPLYRKAVRTSMGATLSLPFAQAPQWPGAIADLRADGFTVVALTPALTAAPLEEIFPHAKLALLVGSEGSGLTEEAMRAATLRIRIPTTPDVDSLNVTTAASIAMYHCFAEKRG